MEAIELQRLWVRSGADWVRYDASGRRKVPASLLALSGLLDVAGPCPKPWLYCQREIACGTRNEIAMKWPNSA
jgi:hypothetical protein